jgi:hypothetical protein
MQLWFLFLDFQKLKETREILVSPVVMVYIAAGILDKTDPCQLLRNWIFENNQFCTRYFYWVFCMFFISKYVNLSSTMHTPRRFCYQECTWLANCPAEWTTGPNFPINASPVSLFLPYSQSFIKHFYFSAFQFSAFFFVCSDE